MTNGYAYAGPRLKTLSVFGLSAYAANNAITLVLQWRIGLI